MRDKISIERVNTLHPDPRVRKEVIDTIDNIEKDFPETMAIRIAEATRTISYQDSLYAQGRTKPGKIVTRAHGGSSYHNYGLAFDFVIMHDKNGDGKFEEASWNITEDYDHDKIIDWQEVVKAFEAKGWEWGGDFRSIKDYPHLQKTFGYIWQQLYNKYLRKDFIKGTEYVNL